MIIEILDTNPVPVPQKGEVVRFDSREPEQGDLSGAESIDQIYDFIRMLDAEDYPPAFVRIGDYKYEFSRASRKVNSIIADVKIISEKNN